MMTKDTLAIPKHYSEHKRGIFGHECLPKLTNGARNARSANKDEIQFQQTGRRMQPITTQRPGELVTMDIV